MLSLIASYLTTHPQAAARSACSEPAMLTPDAQRGSGGSGALELRTDARMWEVQWQELNILRLTGRGSFGFVYLAEWNYTQVAVKVLVSKGESVLGMQPMCAASRWCTAVACTQNAGSLLLNAALCLQTTSPAARWSCLTE